jgi:alpha-methylacyl-CoA racemase
MGSDSGPGPLRGLRVIEVASIGPGPFAAMLLADMGAEVLRLERHASGGGEGPLADGSWNAMHRGRHHLAVDLKDPRDRELVLRVCESADALIEGFRPGVMERLGLGPDEVMKRNPKLVYGRMTGYGQEGPMAQAAGHDINYLSIAGALGASARRGERPMFPLNLLGDFGGGGMLLAFGLVCGLLEARASGRGQVVDAAMVDGVALLSTLIHGLRAGGFWRDEAGTNFLDSGAHFYEVYETGDGGHVAVGAIEPQFYAELLRLLEIAPGDAPQWERDRWPELKLRFAEVFRSRTRAQWAEILEPAEACATAVLGLHEAPEHPHNIARGTFVTVDGVTQPAPAPRFSRTPAAIGHPPGTHTPDANALLRSWGLSDTELATLRRGPAIA